MDTQTTQGQDEPADKERWEKRIPPFLKTFLVLGPALTTRTAYIKATLLIFPAYKALMIVFGYLWFATPESSLWYMPFLAGSLLGALGCALTSCHLVSRRLGVVRGPLVLCLTLALILGVINPYINAYWEMSVKEPVYWLLEAGALFAFLLFPNRWTRWMDAKPTN